MRRLIGLLAGIGVFVLVLPGGGLPHEVRAAAAANTIAYGTRYIKTRDMIWAGFALNVIGVVLVTMWMSTITPVALGIPPGLPDWAVLTPL
ncbi:MAG: hypothetical protein A4E41_00600 [Methanoregulaceae archaeon PtaU1.Bin066]|jgi:di/tricarboxylate transporter|nr:MAG: hypothetical protein A4E41_00600 [Methanoregulaceae archaeon PtaU1.Bin066]